MDSTEKNDREHAEIIHADMVDKEKAEAQDQSSQDPEWRRKEKRLVRKLDMTLMPMVWILYLFNYLDRNNIA